jgi:hypothetical protein
VAWIFGQRPKRQEHISACSVTFAKANNPAEAGVLIVRRSDSGMKRNAEIGFFTKPSMINSHALGGKGVMSRVNGL